VVVAGRQRIFGPAENPSIGAPAEVSGHAEIGRPFPAQIGLAELQGADGCPLVLIEKPPIEADDRLAEDGIRLRLVEGDPAVFVGDLLPIDVELRPVAFGIEPEDHAELADLLAGEGRGRGDEDAPGVEDALFAQKSRVHQGRGVVDIFSALVFGPPEAHLLVPEEVADLARHGSLEAQLGCRSEQGVNHESPAELVLLVVAQIARELECPDGLDSPHGQDIAVRDNPEAAALATVFEAAADQGAHVTAVSPGLEAQEVGIEQDGDVGRAAELLADLQLEIMETLIVLRVEDRALERIILMLREVFREEDPLPKWQIVEVEGTIATELHGLSIIGGQVGEAERPGSAPVTRSGLEVDLVEGAGPEPEMVGRPAEHMKPGPAEEERVDLRKEVADPAAVDFLSEAGRKSAVGGQARGQDEYSLPGPDQTLGHSQTGSPRADDADVVVLEDSTLGKLLAREVHGLFSTSLPREATAGFHALGTGTQVPRRAAS